MAMNITWEQVDDFIDQIVPIVKMKQYKGVYGPARGGLPLAVMLSHRADLPLLQAPCEGCLIIDDIADTGETLKKYDGKIDIITMVYKRHCAYTPYYWQYEKEEDWVIFPWEAKNV